MPQNTLKAFPLTVTPIAGLIGAFGTINGVGYDQPLVQLIINNETDGELLISYDGVTTHDYLPRNDQRILMMPFLSLPNNKCCTIAAHTIIYGLALGTSGIVYTIAYYV